VLEKSHTKSNQNQTLTIIKRKTHETSNKEIKKKKKKKKEEKSMRERFAQKDIN
jgi:hypothetical protein